MTLHQRLGRKIAVALGALSVLAGSVAFAEAPLPSDQAKTMRVGAVDVNVPVENDRVKSEVRVLHPDGKIKVLIPRGFPAGSVPKNTADLGNVVNRAPQADLAQVDRELSHTDQHDHWTAYRWNGRVEAPGVRALWLLDRTSAGAGHEPYVADFVNLWNNDIRYHMAHEQGIPTDWQTGIAYLDDDANEAAGCQKGGYSISNYSFLCLATVDATAIASWCDGSSSTLGCMWSITNGHSGISHQPSGFIRNDLGGCLLRDTIRHELFHGMSSGHNGEPGSIMNPRINNTCAYRFTYHDTQDISSHYRHYPE